jgi:hypothetical protein
MSSEYDPTEFIDGDFQGRKAPASAASAGAAPGLRAPTTEEVAAELARKQQELAAIIREKEEKERERAALEETRRRQMEFHTGREEIIQSLVRGLGLLDEAEFNARREAEQTAKTVAELREALTKVQAIQEATWTKDNFSTELTRGLTALENARMEWNSARLKFPLLSGQNVEAGGNDPQGASAPSSLLARQDFGELCRIGLALTWPLAAVGLLALAALVIALLRH